MKTNIKILMLEDNPYHAKLIEETLKNSNATFTSKVVSDKNGFMAGLEEFGPELILCDHMLADFNSHEALNIFKNRNLAIPFIVVTANDDEHYASRLLMEGADDYILKTNLDRLPVAIHLALKRLDTENKLIASEKKFRALIENSHDIISLMNESLVIIYNSPSVKRIAGWPDGAAGYLAHTHPEDSIRMKRIMKEVTMHPDFPVFTTFRVKHEKGHYIWLEGTITNKLDDPYISAIVSNFRDVTEQIESYDKLSKSEIALRNFANNLNRVQEDERIHIAREIHDELGQVFAGIKMSIGRVSKMTDIQNLQKNMVDITEDINSGIQILRKIATQLRPGILDSLGLIPSIEWLGKEFGRKTGIVCSVTCEAKREKFNQDISSCFFRICQEALTNISKHAEATEVSIHASYDGKVLAMSIADNGKGISSERIENPFSMGLLGMRERANGIGGHLKITSGKDSGTIVCLEVNVV